MSELEYPQERLFRYYDEYTMLTLLAKLEGSLLDSPYGKASEGKDLEGHAKRRPQERQGKQDKPRQEPELQAEAQRPTAGADGQGDVPQLAGARPRREEPTGYL